MRGTDRAVSDMIAFVLVFSLIITSVGITYTYGLSTLTGYQEDEQKRNAERAFVALSDNLGDIEDRQVQGRSGELRLSGGTISVQEDTQFNVSSPNWNQSFDRVGALTYEYEGTRIEYESGAVFRRDGDNRRAMLSEPEIQCSDSHAVVSIVSLSTPEETAYSSDGTAQVVAELDKRYLRYPLNRSTTTSSDTASVDYVNVTIDSSKTEAWGDYFEDEGWTHEETDGNRVTYQCAPDSGQIDLYVRQTEIHIRFIG
ncbi:hypothetical protein G9464_18615 [Halostella sp. JP-L12]|uniref:DUF7289 family protein n=1 Tax=Halostella TaxID=1843185 RepID=UPI000EF80128|nr:MULTISPECIES: hypothetical protein [Halostella]NHN49586.1 hypothetical protein [Halostella sp. JP-L12]